MGPASALRAPVLVASNARPPTRGAEKTCRRGWIQRWYIFPKAGIRLDSPCTLSAIEKLLRDVLPMNPKITDPTGFRATRNVSGIALVMRLIQDS